jgi:hypothetical protein
MHHLFGRCPFDKGFNGWGCTQEGVVGVDF